MYMEAIAETPVVSSSQLQSVASNLNRMTPVRGNGSQQPYLVRLNPTVISLLEAAKPPEQKMVSYLRECALLVSLQRLEDSQK